MTLATAIAVIAAVTAPLGAYVVAARQFSGKVATSDATDLWNESRAMRQWATERIESLTETVGRLENRIRDLESDKGRLTRELEDCRGQL